ncbi:hypothetical protein HNQ60_003763 [Povalibacter uvarum]|uniref:Uncharacterized protein n=1 Tax=Povalibacter uvarum TaxID=732238 RepID=A0A841HPT3_9GAMM|nr:hypothetical protein [Povalibacter uvarum]
MPIGLDYRCGGSAGMGSEEEQIRTGFTLAKAAFFSLGSPDGGGKVSIGGGSVKKEPRAMSHEP